MNLDGQATARAVPAWARDLLGAAPWRPPPPGRVEQLEADYATLTRELRRRFTQGLLEPLAHGVRCNRTPADRSTVELGWVSSEAGDAVSEEVFGRRINPRVD